MKVLKVNIWATLIFFLATVLTEPETFGKLLTYYQLLIVVFIGSCVAHLVQKAAEGSQAANYSLLGFIPFVASIINDILAKLEL